MHKAPNQVESLSKSLPFESYNLLESLRSENVHFFRLNAQVKDAHILIHGCLLALFIRNHVDADLRQQVERVVDFVNLRPIDVVFSREGHSRHSFAYHKRIIVRVRLQIVELLLREHFSVKETDLEDTAVVWLCNFVWAD